MRALLRSRATAPGAVRKRRAFARLAFVLIAAPALGACDVPFQPFEENPAQPFSLFGYLDLIADTQWIRVTPVRQDLLASPEPIDAVVTLEHMGSGRIVTLRDSVFEFLDPRLESAAYVHNFWTTERLERGAAYRLKAVRSDGATTTALVEMPAEAEVELTYNEGPPDVIRDETDPFRDVLRIHVRGEYLVYSDALYAIADFAQTPPRELLVIPQLPVRTDPGLYQFNPPQPLRRIDVADLGRVEARIAVSTSDWPFRPGLSPAEAALPGVGPSNVENGFGFVGGVARWSIPLPRCNPVEARPDGRPVCGHVVGAGAAAIVGKLVDDCEKGVPLSPLTLTARFPGGGVGIFDWKTAWDGSYTFEGIEPGTELVLMIAGARVSEVRIPPLGPGERYLVPVSVQEGCQGGPLTPE